MISARQRYSFAHRMLPRLFLRVPTKFLIALLDPGSALLTSIWNSIGSQLEASGRQSEQAPERFITDARRVAGYNVLVVELQPPRAPTDCYFVAFAYRPAGDGRAAEARYITLEKAAGRAAGIGDTFVCEWTPDGHINFGYGAYPDTDSFLAVLATTLSTNPPSQLPRQSSTSPRSFQI